MAGHGHFDRDRIDLLLLLGLGGLGFGIGPCGREVEISSAAAQIPLRRPDRKVGCDIVRSLEDAWTGVVAK